VESEKKKEHRIKRIEKRPFGVKCDEVKKWPRKVGSGKCVVFVVWN